MGKSILILSLSEKNKTIRVYDMENGIISYQQSTGSDILGDSVNGTNIFLLLKGPASKSTQTLREKSNIDKLGNFIKKNHFDVAYKFAKNEKFSEEVLADISKHYGDFLHGKVYHSFEY